MIHDGKMKKNFKETLSGICDGLPKKREKIRYVSNNTLLKKFFKKNGFFKNFKISFFAKKFTVKKSSDNKNKNAKITVNFLTKKMFDM